MQIAKADIAQEIIGGGVDLAALITLMQVRHPIAAAAGVARAPVAVTSYGAVSTAAAVGNPGSSTKPANINASGGVAPAEASRLQNESSLTTAMGASGSVSIAHTTTPGQSKLQQPLQDAMDLKGEACSACASSWCTYCN